VMSPLRALMNRPRRPLVGLADSRVGVTLPPPQARRSPSAGRAWLLRQRLRSAPGVQLAGNCASRLRLAWSLRIIGGRLLSGL
jgi:hypothetical protein